VAVVRKGKIVERLKRPADDAECLRITPLPEGEDFDEDSVDLRLGAHFFVPRGSRTPHFCPGTTRSELLYQEEYVPFGEFLVIPAHNTVLGATLEFVKLPRDMSGQVLTKSSWARTFIMIETAPWIHPLFRGCLTLEIANVSNTPIVLYPGVRIAQLVLFDCPGEDQSEGDGPAERMKDRIDGTYVGPTRPEPAQFRGPTDSLGSVGVQEEVITYPWGRAGDFIRWLEARGYTVNPPDS